MARCSVYIISTAHTHTSTIFIVHETLQFSICLFHGIIGIMCVRKLLKWNVMGMRFKRRIKRGTKKMPFVFFVVRGYCATHWQHPFPAFLSFTIPAHDNDANDAVTEHRDMSLRQNSEQYRTHTHTEKPKSRKQHSHQVKCSHCSTERNELHSFLLANLSSQWFSWSFVVVRCLHFVLILHFFGSIVLLLHIHVIKCETLYALHFLFFIFSYWNHPSKSGLCYVDRVRVFCI